MYRPAMISFSPEDDEKQLAAAAQRFAQAELRPHLRAHEKARALPAAVQASFHGLGLVGLDLPGALGFGGLPLLTRALVEEELGAGDAGASVALDATGPAGQLIAALGTADQQSAFLQPFLDDPGRAAALAAAESSPGPDFATAAIREGDAWVLRGEKRYVLGGARASLFVVLAQVEAGGGLAGAGAFVVDRAAAGPTLVVTEDRDPVGLAEVPPCSVRLDGVRVPAAARLGSGDLRAALRGVLIRQALASAARGLGCARAAFEVARRYAEDRIAFGKPIGHFQAIAFLLADMATELDGARLLLWRGCGAFDRNAADAELRAAQAIVHAHAATFFVTSNAVQILGGAGYVQDHPVEKWMRDAKALALHVLPTQAAQALAIAAGAGEPVADEDLFCFFALQPALT